MTRHDLLIDYNPWLRVYEGWCDDCSNPDWEDDQHTKYSLYYGRTLEEVQVDHDDQLYA